MAAPGNSDIATTPAIIFLGTIPYHTSDTGALAAFLPTDVKYTGFGTAEKGSVLSVMLFHLSY